MAQTSDRVSSIGRKYWKIGKHQLMNMPLDELHRDVQTMGASLVRQDEHKGIRGLIRKVTGK